MIFFLFFVYKYVSYTIWFNVKTRRYRKINIICTLFNAASVIFCIVGRLLVQFNNRSIVCIHGGVEGQ